MAKQWPWALLAIGVACATAAAYEHASSDSPLIWLYAPGFIGEVLAGGVHGGASERVLEAAWSVANGLFWATALKILFFLGRVARRAYGGRFRSTQL
jgi:hypothetical protein